MRTKTLLVACAALAFSLATSQAQVYSQNIVGYANVVLHGNGHYSLVANPFDAGNGNYVTNLLNSALPKQSQYLIWNVSSYYTVGKLATGGWQAPLAAGGDQVPPGVGFFVRNGSPGSGAPDLTNTFVGTVIPNIGLTVTNSEPIGYTLQGSPIPYAGNLAIIGAPGGDANLDYGSPLTKQSQILTWDPVGQSFLTVGKIATGNWSGTANAAVDVGAGFFIFNKNGPATNMVQTLNP
jgi:hypothetical protein